MSNVPIVTRIAEATTLCGNCSMPIRKGEPMTLLWFGWTHAVDCPTEVSR